MSDTANNVFPELPAQSENQPAPSWLIHAQARPAKTEPLWQDLDADKNDGLIRETPEQRDKALEKARLQGVKEGIEQARLTLQKELREQVHKEIFEQSSAEGKNEGKQLGYQDGLDQAQQAIQSQLDLLKELQNQMQLLQAARLHNQQQLLRDVVTALTSRAVLAELKLQPEVINQAILAALNALPDTSEIPVITLNPADRETVELFRTKLDTEWNILEDPNIQAGGCRVETTQSEVDSTLTRRLDMVQQAVHEAFSNAD